MIEIKEYLLSANKKNKVSKIHVNNGYLKQIVNNEIAKNGLDADLNYIDVSEVSDFSYAFTDYSMFCGDVSEWDVSAGKNFSFMFGGCEDFNCDISQWDMSNAIKAKGMFSYCRSFNQDLSRWDVSNIVYAERMFANCFSFVSNVGNFNFYSLEQCEAMFINCSKFNQDVSNFMNGHAKEDITSIFNGCTSFEGKGLENWKTNKIKRAAKAFKNCKRLNADLSNWDLASLYDAESMFEGCESLNCDCSNWILNKSLQRFPEGAKKMFFKSGVKKAFRPTKFTS